MILDCGYPDFCFVGKLRFELYFIKSNMILSLKLIIHFMIFFLLSYRK